MLRQKCRGGVARPYEYPNDDAIRLPGGRTQARGRGEDRELQSVKRNQVGGKKSRGTYNFHYIAMRAETLTTRKCLRSLVGARRFERRTSCAQGRRATRLRYAPTVVTRHSTAIAGFVFNCVPPHAIYSDSLML